MIELRDVSKTYRMGGVRGAEITVRALQKVSLTIQRGEYVAIMGPSGSGKSTMMHVLGLLDVPDEGSYRLLHQEVAAMTESRLAELRSRAIGFVFQQFNLLPRTSAVNNVALPLLYRGGKNGGEAPMELLKRMGMEDRSFHHSNELSGGQQQRVAIARSLVNQPPIILADEPTGNLDSASQEEILGIFDELNREGKTIILITHEVDVAKRARRVIRMKDGRIISDERQGEGVLLEVRNQKSEVSQFLALNSQSAIRNLQFAMVEMGSHVHQAFVALVSNKVRSALSMLGILIGVAALISMMALGSGAQKSLADQMSSMGSNLLSVRPGSRRVMGVAQEGGAVTRFTLADAEAIAAELPTVVRRVAPSVQGSVQVVFGAKNARTRLTGTTPLYGLMRNFVAAVGRFFTDEEVSTRARVVLLGAGVVKQLFPAHADPVGETIKINRTAFTVIGVLKPKGASSWMDHDDVVMMPVTTAMFRMLGKEHVDTIDVEIVSSEALASGEQALKEMITRRHRLAPSQTDSFDIRNMAEIQEAVSATTRTFSTLLGAIAAVSLLVGGIGIMNIMLVSVTERTREIGLRKAVGAQPRDILWQFLVEAVIVSLLGGGMGVLVGAGISTAIARLAGWAVIVTPFSVWLAVSFSMAVGVVFGLWPARRAARLHPIEALRYE